MDRPKDVIVCPDAQHGIRQTGRYFRTGGFSILTRGGMPMTMMRVNLIKGLGPLQIVEGWTADPTLKSTWHPEQGTDKTWLHHVVRATSRPEQGCIQECLRRDEQLVPTTVPSRFRTYRCRPHHPGIHPAYPCLHAQWRRRKSSVHRLGTHSAWIKKVPTTELALTTAQFTSNRIAP